MQNIVFASLSIYKEAFVIAQKIFISDFDQNLDFRRSWGVEQKCHGVCLYVCSLSVCMSVCMSVTVLSQELLNGSD